MQVILVRFKNKVLKVIKEHNIEDKSKTEDDLTTENGK